MLMKEHRKTGRRKQRQSVYLDRGMKKNGQELFFSFYI